MKRQFLSGLLLAVVGMALTSIPAYAGLTFTDLPQITEGSIPSTLTLTASFTNDSGASVFLNNLDAGFTDGGNITIDPTFFVVDFARQYTEGDSQIGSFLTLELPPDLTFGVYHATATVQGGASGIDFTDLYSVPFTLTVNAAAVPEGIPVELTGIIGAGLLAFHVKRRKSSGK